MLCGPSGRLVGLRRSTSELVADLAGPVATSLRMVEAATPSILAAQKMAGSFASSVRLADFSRATSKLADDLAGPIATSLRMVEAATPSILAQSGDRDTISSPDMENFEALEFSIGDALLVLYISLVLMLMLVGTRPPAVSHSHLTPPTNRAADTLVASMSRRHGQLH